MNKSILPILAGLSFGLSVSEACYAKNPNILFIVGGDMGYGDYLNFPNLKNLAANSRISSRVSSAHAKGRTIEIRQDSEKGKLMRLNWFSFRSKFSI